MGVVRRVVNNINTVVLHNNDYVEVHERFRILHELKKDFETLESGPQQIGERLLWRVVAKVDGKQYIGHAEVKLSAPKGTADGTNPFECAETSAWGRLLAFAGLGTVQSIASYDEIARSQPFTQIVEQPNQKQIVSAAPALDNDLKVRLNSLFERAKPLGVLPEPTAKGFLRFASEALGVAITHPNQLDADKLDQIEAEIARKETEAVQLEVAS